MDEIHVSMDEIRVAGGRIRRLPRGIYPIELWGVWRFLEGGDGGAWHHATVQTGHSARAWYAASIDDFGATASEAIVGTLATNGGFTLLTTQRDAWLAQIAFLRERLHGLTGTLFFEFSIPRMGRRIDVVLLIGGVVFVLEFKVGAITYDGAAVDQVWDYALDLKNFHEASHHLTIVPVLVATDASAVSNELTRDSDAWFALCV